MAEEFMYKNKLQEYAQRSAIPLPIYNTVNEGAPHAPQFRSSVIVDGSRYTSNCTFSSKKAAEQYAARYALEAIRSFIRNNSLSVIPNNSVIFKSILHEYAVKMNIKFPTYETCRGWGTIPMFISSVSFDNNTFKGAFGKSKKEAEQIGARAVIEFILGNSDSGTVMAQIIKSKDKLDATVPKLNGSSSSEIGNVVMIGPMVHQTNVNQLEMQSTPNCDPSTFQPCYPEPPPAATLTNASAGHSVPSGTAVEKFLCQRCSELISNEKCPEIPDVAVATGKSTSDISKNAHSEQNSLHPDQGKSEVPSDDSGNDSSESQGNASKKRRKRENEQSPSKKARVDEALQVYEVRGMAEEFMYKNKLQDYAQRSAIPLPIYNTVNEGTPHAPRFRSSVIVDGSRFTSNCTFSIKKAAEQYAARYALEAIRSFIRNNSLSLIPPITRLSLNLFCMSMLTR